MEVKIVNKKENPLLNRVELSGDIVFQGVTPSNADLQKFIAGQMNVDPSLVKVGHIFNVFGETKAKFSVNIYKSKDQLDTLEPIGKKAKEKLAKAAGSETKAEEAPKQESKE